MRDPFSHEVASFEQPLTLLQACHERVRHYSGLLVRMAEHQAVHGSDEQLLVAAQSVLRYFDVAAPLHHADEDDDLFAALWPRVDASVQSSLSALSAEHGVLEAEWAVWRVRLQALVAGEAVVLDPDAARDFSHRYVVHAAREEKEVYPWAEQVLSTAELSALGQRMAARRQSSRDASPRP
ncbi:hemerythrin domain-containing protein [Chitinolyticbacter albus]|uniref:hemerythrin domain-containing protein n=1 Tax=Chitinolyticbacter albus TaxID=2961951 RepID=UPI00210924F1|nr:hemerythrin domain-containing protein [Chitinolyticbacter albus]